MRHLLLFSVLATLAGATSYQKIIAFIALQRERLNAIFGACFRRAPAVNTLRHLFALVSCVARVSRLTFLKNTRTGLWATREEVGYYPAKPATAPSSWVAPSARIGASKTAPITFGT